jgi:hypothetical protein
MEEHNKELDKLVKDTQAPKTEIEKTVLESMTSFIKMI